MAVLWDGACFQQRGRRSHVVLAGHQELHVCRGLIVWGTGRSKAGNGVTLGAGGQSAAHAATDGLRKAGVAS